MHRFAWHRLLADVLPFQNRHARRCVGRRRQPRIEALEDRLTPAVHLAFSANVLTQRLEGMERVGIVARRKLPPPASVQVYELTALGYSAEVAIQELGRWAAQSPLHDATLPLSAASAMLSLNASSIARPSPSILPMDVSSATIRIGRSAETDSTNSNSSSETSS